MHKWKLWLYIPLSLVTWNHNKRKVPSVDIGQWTSEWTIPSLASQLIPSPMCWGWSCWGCVSIVSPGSPTTALAQCQHKLLCALVLNPASAWVETRPFLPANFPAQLFNAGASTMCGHRGGRSKELWCMGNTTTVNLSCAIIFLTLFLYVELCLMYYCVEQLKIS